MILTPSKQRKLSSSEALRQRSGKKWRHRKIFTPSTDPYIYSSRSDRDIILFTNPTSSCEAPKKRQGFSPCILKKIIVVCNHWVLLAPTHDFLFNPKTAYRY
ncbi:hypothetical protein [Okeania sp. KiyG1]|uniref:hypothetical protein n=1 Tax=Okeania sp. KiyG1 TaxID=2720165 RepID=UPI00192069BA|nr:hypothetical protein [Okeania sp. KiyG1]